MFIVAVPLYLLIIGSATWLMVIMKPDNRSDWVKNNFDIIRNIHGFGG